MGGSKSRSTSGFQTYTIGVLKSRIGGSTFGSSHRSGCRAIPRLPIPSWLSSGCVSGFQAFRFLSVVFIVEVGHNSFLEVQMSAKLWSHISDAAIVSHTPDRPRHGLGNHVGPHIAGLRVFVRWSRPSGTCNPSAVLHHVRVQASPTVHIGI